MNPFLLVRLKVDGEVVAMAHHIGQRPGEVQKMLRKAGHAVEHLPDPQWGAVTNPWERAVLERESRFGGLLLSLPRTFKSGRTPEQEEALRQAKQAQKQAALRRTQIRMNIA